MTTLVNLYHHILKALIRGQNRISSDGADPTVQRYCSYLLRKPLFHLVSVYVGKELVSRGPGPMRNRRQTVTYRKCGAGEEKKRDVRIMEHILNMLCVS